MPTAIQVLSKYWGYDNFRPLQKEIIESVAGGKDTLALMPTGGGKSLCFQIPALMHEGLCLVISPLIALMKDQVENLRKRDIKAEAIYSGLHYWEIEQIIENCIHGNIKLLYLSPERLNSELFQERLPQLPINFIAIDEAHCISQWGYDFRPAYLQIAQIKEQWPGIPMIALTATATEFVRKDIVEKLEFKEPEIFVKSFARSNLSYSIRYVEDKLGKLLNILNNVPGTGIVYVRSRRGTEQLAEFLQNNNISADFYHAGLSTEERSSKQEKWINNEIRVIACTNAFGMGIDKPDVRVVIHINLPESLEEYYQEAGRAGRDGLKAYAVLLFKEGDGQNLLAKFEKSMPSLSFVKEVYHSLSNYLDVAYEAGEGLTFNYDLMHFSATYQLPPLKVFNSLKILEQDNYIALTEGFLKPSQVCFRVDKSGLNIFLDANESYDNIVKSLLRSYAGIMEGFRYINEERIADSLIIPISEVIEQLNQLQQYNILYFTPRSDLPKIMYNSPRLTKDNLRLNVELYEFRRNLKKGNIEAMINYATTTEECRSRLLLAYFGETDGQNCGVCDFCLRKTQTTVNVEQAKDMRTKVQENLQNQPKEFSDLVESFPETESNKVIYVIRSMMDEGEIRVDESDLLTWNG